MIGVRQAFAELQHYGIQISSYEYSQTDAGSFEEKANEILKSRPEGVVLAPFFSRESRKFISQLEERHIPYIFIDSNLKDCNKTSYIGQNSFQSGALSAKLIDFSLPGKANIFVVHFAKEMDNQNHLVLREQGFYNYFGENDPQKNRNLHTIEIENINAGNNFYTLIDQQIEKYGQPDGIFVTNSQVYRVAAYMKERNLKNIRLIGHDLIRQNIEYLREGIVDFLICQRPEEQGYQAINNLFSHVILKKQIPAENYTSIDIITKENLDFYKEFNLINYGTN